MRSLLAIALLISACGGDEAHKLESGTYGKTTTEIAQDDCNVAGTLGMTNSNYGILNVTSQQVTHTDQATFTNEVYARNGNTLTRPMAMSDFNAGGPMNNCLLNDVIQDSGSISGDDIVTITRHESHSMKSGDCTGILRINCQSTYTFKLTRLGP